MSLQEIKTEVEACTRCPLHQTRTHTVFGSGSAKARLMLVGEGPGEREDLTGEPFVGPAGELLTKLLGRCGIDRQGQTYIANIVKCRPPGNRDPEPGEASVCLPFLHRQILELQPEVILTLGRHASSRLTLCWGPMADLIAAKRFTYTSPISTVSMTIPIIPQFHPAYLLRLIHKKDPDAKEVLKQFLQRLDAAKRIAVKPKQLSLLK